jgi:glycosyltransferase involved in cell wall biosynthesis
MISLIILAYNDGRSLEEHLPWWIAVLENQPDYELIIADDGSTDDTTTIVARFMKNNQRVRHVRSNSNHGVGANFSMGIQHAKGDVIAYTDGDGQYLPFDLLALLKLVGENDMVTGRRISRADPLLRSFTSFIYNHLVRIIYNVPVRDINSGLKIFTRKFIDSCSPQYSCGPFYDAEYIIKGYKQGMRIKEIPIAHQSRKHGRAAGVSARSIRMLFSEVCTKQMQPYIKRNYLSRLMFRLLAS